MLLVERMTLEQVRAAAAEIREDERRFGVEPGDPSIADAVIEHAERTRGLGLILEELQVA